MHRYTNRELGQFYQVMMMKYGGADYVKKTKQAISLFETSIAEYYLENNSLKKLKIKHVGVNAMSMLEDILHRGFEEVRREQHIQEDLSYQARQRRIKNYFKLNG